MSDIGWLGLMAGWEGVTGEGNTRVFGWWMWRCGDRGGGEVVRVYETPGGGLVGGLRLGAWRCGFAGGRRVAEWWERGIGVLG